MCLGVSSFLWHETLSEREERGERREDCQQLVTAPHVPLILSHGSEGRRQRRERGGILSSVLH